MKEHDRKKKIQCKWLTKFPTILFSNKINRYFTLISYIIFF